MSLRPHIAADHFSAPRPSARVERVCELLDCDESHVRRLVDRGDLEAHLIGKRGIRVFLDSVAEYQDRQRRPVKKPVHKREKPRTAARAAQMAAEAQLRKSGILS